MDLFKVSKSVERETVIEALLQCALCGENLKFEHKVDHATHQVTEEGQCTCCGIRTKKQEHRLQ